MWNNRVAMDKHSPEGELEENHPKLTKRWILSQISHIFDPVGFVPRCRILDSGKGSHAATLAAIGLDRDQKLPIHEQNKWRKLFGEMG